MDGGRIVAEGSPRSLIDTYATREVVELRFRTDDDRTVALRAVDGTGERVESVADRVLVYTDHGDAAVQKVQAEGIEPASLLVRRSTLEDVFLIITGRTLDD
jgi:lipooligosaccharide transport system ATP-binding protein